MVVSRKEGGTVMASSFVPDRTKPARDERGRLWQIINRLPERNVLSLAALTELDSELFDVTTTDSGPYEVMWRDQVYEAPEFPDGVDEPSKDEPR